VRNSLLICLVMVILLASIAANGETVRERKPNLIGGEIGGRAILYSVNFERYLTNRVGIGAGLMGFGTSDGAVGLVPFYLSFIPVGDMHSMYCSFGATAAAGSANWETLDAAWLGTFSLGYQYQSETGFFARPTLNMIYNDGGWLILPGVAIGGSF
jgi:hypothetical protein